ncbi:dihydrofolate reductase family protein [Mycoplasma marinum]|uniref:Uncharacterized protein n=1 Tax=Mycoplasma marinum TaxID=1937190 RepID=A0A4R0XRM3_9MOLU|nr:dihydrofolate reductase [Mycoplasma marinum]TCG11060.1 hypothetical protein C4B24_03180 [Mycoplasma marinum]
MKYSTFIATSKDGYIADANGSVDFLDKIDPVQTQKEYWEYYGSIDVLIFGSKTYESILSFELEKWPYEDKICFVLTSNPDKYQPQKGIIFFDKGIEELTKNHMKDFKHAWIMGGSKVINDFIDYGLIEEMTIFETNDILNSGTALFENKKQLNKFILIEKQQYINIKSKKYIRAKVI